jgi:hypothetical protein
MPKFEVRQTGKLNLTSYSGLALIGQCCEAAQVDRVIDPRLPVSQGMKTSDLVKAIGALSLGRSNFKAIEPFRTDRFFKEALGLSKVPSSAWMRQRLDAKASELRALTDELSVRLLECTKAPITPYKGYVRFEIDTFVMDNSDTKKEDVGRTYQGVDGYCPIAGYLGNEGWNVGLELRAGAWHCARQTEYFYERAFARVKRLVKPTEAVLIVEVTERTIDRKGQHLLAPEIELEGWWTSLDLPAKEVIEHYLYHGTHEQFHAEIKSDLDLERLPSGKFDTNDCVLHLGTFAYNCLRLLGQLGLTGEIVPVRHPAKRRRLKTVLQEIMYLAAKFVAHARKLVLDFGRNVTEHVKVFVALQERLV